MDDLASELGRRKRTAWGAYKSIENLVKKTKNIRLRAHLFNTTVLPALTYTSKAWAQRKQNLNAISVVERPIEKVILLVTRLTRARLDVSIVIVTISSCRDLNSRNPPWRELTKT
ncbi:hypothetical protein Y032_0019g3847 [Ancylostoma ceylanicum]|nr:hypothetical protein Y032_0019g3847 [Ancylostoma ceylanicum]